MLKLAHPLPNSGRIVRKLIGLLVLTVALIGLASDFGTKKATATMCCSYCYQGCDDQYDGCVDNCMDQTYGIPDTFSLCLNACVRQHTNCQNNCLDTCDGSC